MATFRVKWILHNSRTGREQNGKQAAHPLLVKGYAFLHKHAHIVCTIAQTKLPVWGHELPVWGGSEGGGPRGPAPPGGGLSTYDY